MGMKPTIRLNHNLLAVETDHSVHVMLELTAPVAPNDIERTPLKLALVIDRSGSMDGPKLATTKACAAHLVRRLSPTDEMAVVTYDDQVELVAPLAPVHGDALLAAIDTIRPGGSTNLSGGWLKGVKVLRSPAPDANGHGRTTAPPATRRVLLLTDGQANVGVTEPGALVGMATTARGEGVATTTIGFGDDFEEATLTAMGDAGGGNSHYAPTPEAAPAIFADEFEGLASVVAQNLSVEIGPGDDVVVTEVLNTYPMSPVAGGLQLALGDSYGGERRAVVFSLHLPAVADLGVAKVADVVLRYVSLGDQIAAHEVTLPVVVNVVTAEEAAQAEVDHGVVDEVLVLQTAHVRDEARLLADAGDYEAGRSLLKDSAEKLRRSAPRSAKAAELLAEADKLDEVSEELSGPSYDAATRKRLYYEAHQTRRRRGP